MVAPGPRFDAGAVVEPRFTSARGKWAGSVGCVAGDLRVTGCAGPPGMLRMLSFNGVLVIRARA